MRHSLKKLSFSICANDLNKKYQPRLKRVTQTKFINETQPVEIGHFKYTYLAESNGGINRFQAIFDSTISSVDTVISYRYFSKSTGLTNYKRNILEMDYNPNNKNIGLLMLEQNSFKIYLGKANLDGVNTYEGLDNFDKNSNNNNFIKEKSTVEIISTSIDTSENNNINIANYQFSKTKIVKPKKKEEETNLVFLNQTTKEEKSKEAEKFIMPHSKLYRINFAYDNLTSQLDKNFLNNSYQVYNPTVPVFSNPSLNMFNMVKMKDLMEDYRVIAGVNLGFNLQDNDYLLSYENLKDRIDKKYLFVRQAYTSDVGDYSIRTKSFEFKYRLKYPFNEISAIGVTFNYRRDISIYKSVDRISAGLENFQENNGGIKIEYVFDNTFDKGINLYEGTRLKFFGEFTNELFKKETDFFVLGGDIRHYQKIHRELIYAGRIATSTSFGSRKLVYYMGGVDGGFAPRFNEETIIPLDKGFAFQTIATPMRGFIQNTRFFTIR